MSTKRCYEDFQNNFSMDFQVAGLSTGEIKEFARQYDPQPFHLDEAEASKTHFGHLCASGFQTQVLCFRGFCDRVLLNSWCVGSPGINSIKWLRPWYVDEPVDVNVCLVDKRRSSKRDDRGYLSFELRAKVGEAPLMDIEWVVIVLTREGCADGS